MLRQALSTIRVRAMQGVFLLCAVLLLPGCDGDDPIAPVPTVSGTVTVSATGDPVSGARVSIGDLTVATGSDGRFELSGLSAGPATLRSVATGFEDFETEITVGGGRTTRDVPLTRIELFEFEEFAIHIPASVSKVRTVVVALGGPDTRGFAAGTLFGAPVPQVEASLQALGQEFRNLAASHGLAIFGTSLAAMANGAASDELLLDAIEEASGLSGRDEIASAPVLVYGMSGGAAQGSGFTARNPGRVVGLFLKVPAGIESLTVGDVLGVPTYMVQAELDAFVDNAALRATFAANRRSGGLWALALEPGAPHHSLNPVQRELTIEWMATILDLRLDASAPQPLLPIVESSGWLGDMNARSVVPWADYAGDPRSASWLPSQATAEQWTAFITNGS